MSTTPVWSIRAVQLDLARQRETLETIERFIAFIKDWGYNTLVLYLEGVVRTPSFPYRPAEASYDADDVKRIVAAAQAAGIDVVPGLSTLDHAEHFLSCPELAHLREPDIALGSGQMFSPTNPETYKFLEAYMSDIAELFPGPNLHVGCDESWTLGGGAQSQARLAAGETIDDLFIEHVRKVHAIAARLGKRTWIWDDMLENSGEEKYAELPRDMVMCYWHYPGDLIDVDGIQGHFNGLRRRNLLAMYKRLGMDALVCPWSAKPQGVLGHTRYAREQQTWGGLQTMWELGARFLPGELPGVALAGLLWSNPEVDPDIAIDQTLARLLPDLPVAARPAVSIAMQSETPLSLGPIPQGLLRGRLTTNEAGVLDSQLLARNVLAQQVDAIDDPFQKEIVTELLVRTRTRVLAGRLRQLFADTTDPRIRHANHQTRRSTVQWCRDQMQELKTLMHDRWLVLRPGILPVRTDGQWDGISNGLSDLLEQACTPLPADHMLVVVKLFLWECYSAPRLRVELGYGGQWEEVFVGSVKPADLTPGHYVLRLPMRRTRDADPDAIRFSVSLFGGQGVSFTSIHFGDRDLVPQSLGARTGRVHNAEAVLIDDAGFAFLGSPDTVHTFETQTSSETSTLEVKLAGQPR